MVNGFKSQLSSSAAQTQEIAGDFAHYILQQKPQSSAVVLGLQGDLGAGKTTFLQGFAKGLGIEEVVNSPTFVIMKRFMIYDSRFKNFYHFDCYRLENPEEILELGFGDIIKDPTNIVAIEWPEKITKLMPKKNINIAFKHLEENTREVAIVLPSEKKV